MQGELLSKTHGLTALHAVMRACGFHTKIKIMIRVKEIIVQEERPVLSGNMLTVIRNCVPIIQGFDKIDRS